MKNVIRISSLTLIAGILILFAVSCKKDKEDPVPVFTVTYDSVDLVGGGKGLQFTAKSTNNGVSMANATITNPTGGIYVHNMNGTSFEQNAAIPLQASGQAYTKLKGTWKFNLVGSSSGGTSFTLEATTAVEY